MTVQDLRESLPSMLPRLGPHYADIEVSTKMSWAWWMPLGSVYVVEIREFTALGRPCEYRYEMARLAEVRALVRLTRLALRFRNMSSRVHNLAALDLGDEFE